MSREEMDRLRKLSTVERGLVDHDDHEPEDLQVHLIEAHGWSMDMVVTRSADPGYQPNWHRMAHLGRDDAG